MESIFPFFQVEGMKSKEGYVSAPEIKLEQVTDPTPPTQAKTGRRNSWSSGESTSSNRTDISTVVNAPTSVPITAPGSPDPDGSEASDSVLSDNDASQMTSNNIPSDIQSVPAKPTPATHQRPILKRPNLPPLNLNPQVGIDVDPDPATSLEKQGASKKESMKRQQVKTLIEMAKEQFPKKPADQTNNSQPCHGPPVVSAVTPFARKISQGAPHPSTVRPPHGVIPHHVHGSNPTDIDPRQSREVQMQPSRHISGPTNPIGQPPRHVYKEPPVHFQAGPPQQLPPRHENHRPIHHANYKMMPAHQHQQYSHRPSAAPTRPPHDLQRGHPSYPNYNPNMHMQHRLRMAHPHHQSHTEGYPHHQVAPVHNQPSPRIVPKHYKPVDGAPTNLPHAAEPSYQNPYHQKHPQHDMVYQPPHTSRHLTHPNPYQVNMQRQPYPQDQIQHQHQIRPQQHSAAQQHLQFQQQFTQQHPQQTVMRAVNHQLRPIHKPVPQQQQQQQQQHPPEHVDQQQIRSHPPHQPRFPSNTASHPVGTRYQQPPAAKTFHHDQSQQPSVQQPSNKASNAPVVNMGNPPMQKQIPPAPNQEKPLQVRFYLLDPPKR